MNGTGATAALVAAALSVAIAACSTATPYQPHIAGQRVSGGYSDFKLAEEILTRRGPIPAGEERAFDARKVVQDLGPTIERPKPRG